MCLCTLFAHVIVGQGVGESKKTDVYFFFKASERDKCTPSELVVDVTLRRDKSMGQMVGRFWVHGEVAPSPLLHMMFALCSKATHKKAQEPAPCTH